MELLGGVQGAANFVIAFLLVLGLIGAGALLWRRFGVGPLRTTGPRGRQPRLAVIDFANVDGRRRLVLIRRDNTEHLIMIGGPTDVVVESNIARAAAVATARDQRPGPVPDVPARPSPLDDRPGWPPPIEPPLRVARPLDPLLTPQGADAERLEPTLRASREPVPTEPVARMTRNEPAVRPPLVSAERFPAQFDEDEDESDAPALTPPPPPPAPPEHPAMVAEPRRPQVQPPPPPAYEPSFQPAPAAERRPTSVPPPPPPVAPPVEAPAFQRAAAEPRRMAARPMPAPPLPQPPPPPDPAESASEAAWLQATSLPPPAQDLDQPAARPAPAFQSTVLTEAKRVQAAPPKPSQNDESNLAEMAQRLEAALRRPIKPVEPAPPPTPPVPVRAPAPAAPAANPAARAAAYFEPPPARGSAGRGQESAPAPVLKVVPAQEKPPSLEEEMASLLGRSTGKT
jgi:flagellar protein FliO/FliZ